MKRGTIELSDSGEIAFRKVYFDLSRVSPILSVLESYGLRVGGAIRNIHLLLLIDQLCENSHIVYSGPEKGRTLEVISPFIRGCKITLIDIFTKVGSEENRIELLQLIDRIDHPNLTFIEGNFYDMWSEMSNVDFLLLDGPNLPCNFTPFSSRFFCVMHDINARVILKKISSEILPFLCKTYDEAIFQLPGFDKLTSEQKELFLKMRKMVDDGWGSYGWFMGFKEGFIHESL